MIIFPGNFENDDRKELIKHCRRLESFFGVNPGDFKIIKIASRQALDKTLDRKTPSWLVGIAQDREILVLDRTKIAEESNHSETEFIQILKHEICHLFINELNPLCSRSLEEGLCLYFAGQNREAVIKQENFDLFFGRSNFYNILDGRDFSESQGYQLSYMTVKNLMEVFDRKEILSFIAISRRDQNWKTKIESISGMSFTDYLKVIQNGIKIK